MSRRRQAGSGLTAWLGGNGCGVPPAPSEPVVDRLTVPSLPASIASVRRFAVAACRTSGLVDLCDTLALLVSEVATNALVHGSGEVQVRVHATDSGLRVEVQDDSPTMPSRRRAGPLEEGGRGLALVDTLARGWGVQALPVGKVVWFELGAA